jgi:hypothetical protein
MLHKYKSADLRFFCGSVFLTYFHLAKPLPQK